MSEIEPGTSSGTSDYRLEHLRKRLGEQYEFKAMLGRGAFATVYLVRNRRLERHEALKVLSEAYDGDEAFVQRFIREAKLVASLDHPNIVKVFDYGEVDGIVWYSMQYVDGPTLTSELFAQGKLPPTTVASLAVSLLDALDYSHLQGIVHRDIKPSNILLNRRGRPFIMDFGIAKSTASAFKTMTGKILGTPTYISPEQVEAREVDGRADLYSLAITLYEMLTGRTPFRAEGTLNIILARVQQDPDPLSLHFPDVDPKLEDTVMRALQRQPEDRHADAGTMQRQLLEYLSREESPSELVLRAKAPVPIDLVDLSSGVGSMSEATAATRMMTSRASKLRLGSRLRGAGIGLALAFGLLLLIFTRDSWFRPAGDGELPAAVPAAGIEDPATASRPATEPTVEPANDLSIPNTSENEGGHKTSAVLAKQEGSDTNPAENAVGRRSDDPAPAAPPSQRTSPAPPLVEPARTRPAPPIVRRAVQPPRIASDQDPVAISGALAERCAEADVLVSVRVGEDGRTEKVKILQSPHEECSDAARKAALGYLFEPAEDYRGAPVAADVALNIRFEVQP